MTATSHGWYVYGSRSEAGAPDTVLLAHDGPIQPEHHDQLRALLAPSASTIEWAVQVTSRLTGRSEIVPKPNEASARRAVWEANARGDQDARVMTRTVTAWTAEVTR